MGLKNLTKDYHSLRLATNLNIINSNDIKIKNLAKSQLETICQKRSAYLNVLPISYLSRNTEEIKSMDIRSLLSSIRLNRKALDIELTESNSDDKCSIDLNYSSLFIPENIPEYRIKIK